MLTARRLWQLDGQRITAEVDILIVLAETLGVALPETFSGEVLSPMVGEALTDSGVGDRPLVVLVDDADQLEGAALHRLLALCAEHRFRLLLFGRPGLPELVKSATRELDFAPYEISLLAFPPNDVRQYLEWRFEQAGNKGGIPFTEDQISDLYRRSNGVPGELNRLAGHQLELMRDEGAGLPSFKFPSTHLYLVAGLAAVLALSFLLVDRVDLTEEVVTENLPLTITEAAEEPGSMETADPSLPRFSAPQGVGERSEPSEEPAVSVTPPPAADEPTRVIPADAASSPPESSLAAAEQEALESSPAATPIPPPEPALAEAQPQPAEPARSAEASAPTQTQGAQERAATVPAEETAQEPETAGSQPMTLAALTDSILREVPGLRDGTWLLAQAADDYTLQLVTLSSRDGLLRYLKRQREPGSFAVYARQVGDNLLYVVTYGQFASRIAAEAASRRLPAEIGKIKPWIRPFSEVQRAVTAPG